MILWNCLIKGLKRRDKWRPGGTVTWHFPFIYIARNVLCDTLDWLVVESNDDLNSYPRGTFSLYSGQDGGEE